MKNYKQGLIVPLLIVIIAVLVIGGGIYFYSKSNQNGQQTVAVTSNDDKPENYNGTYEFTEIAPGLPNSGQPNMVEDYKLKLQKEENSRDYIVDINIDGFQTLERLHAGGIMSATKLTVIFYSYSSPDSMKLYKKGDVLFDLELQPVGENKPLKIDWNKMHPNFDNTDKSNNFFVKTNTITETQPTPISNISQTNPLADIQVLSNTIPAGSYGIVKGGPSACQPDFFDPKVTKFQKVPTGGSPAEMYQIEGQEEGVGMMINGWAKEGEDKISLASPFDLTTYQFGCASSFSFVADITKNAVRQSLFTNIDNYLTQKSVSEDETHIFIVNNIKDANSNWQLKKRIVNIENDTKTDLPNMTCVSDLGFWNGNKLLTFSDKNLVSANDDNSNYQTKVCVWNTDGKLLNQVAAKLYWPAASAYYLGAQIGLLSKDSNIFYTYNSVASGQNACYVNLQDLTNQSKNKKIKITDADSNGVCPSVKLDLSNVTFSSNTIPYQVVTQ